ncbi:hypothetical protein [Lysobacter hankyongensis]|uniref:Uncharacterized protein n=1 Tax=Lysobacter hankyongensis TaxID=1176535 RepID=A0ABP9C2T9_9GAMM
MSDNGTFGAQRVSTLPRTDASARVDVGRALAAAKAHFVARGWRPLAIQPPSLRERCEDVMVSLLMSDAGETLWLSSRDWSALPHPQDAFRREMACVREARVDQTILVHDGDFPDGVVEAAAHTPRLRLIDAAILREMPAAGPSRNAAGAAIAAATGAPASAVPAATYRQRLAQPARRAARYLSQVVDARPVAAAERYFHDTFARRLRQVDGERRRLKTLGTAALMAIGASIGFFAFNLVWLKHAPEGDDNASLRVAQAETRPLPQPLPPPQGYVAQAAGVSSPMQRTMPAHAAFGGEAYPSNATRSATASVAPVQATMVAMAGDAGTAHVQYPLDVGEARRRADEAIDVIASSTPEVRGSYPSVAPAPDAVDMDPVALPEDPARVD